MDCLFRKLYSGLVSVLTVGLRRIPRLDLLTRANRMLSIRHQFPLRGGRDQLYISAWFTSYPLAILHSP